MDWNPLELRQRLWDTSLKGEPPLVRSALPLVQVKALIAQATALLKIEPTLLELSTPPEVTRVIMVGDTHGHFHDVCNMLDQFGYPSDNTLYIFNGDYVDRGSWGYELLVLLLSLKVAWPDRCYLLRGNHESTTCTTWYGFKAELNAKWGKDSTSVYAQFKKMFAVLPLAACVNQATLILHGGLFRSVSPPLSRGAAKVKGAAKRKRAAAPAPGGPTLGCLDTLRHAGKGGADPDGQGSSVVATDVLWSDPGIEPGLRENDVRGVGMVFGPDVTQSFLTANNLRLILRSHEGPDARDKRGDLPQVTHGYALDHDTPAGKLMTVFSAPDYPQFMASCEDRYNNQGAVAVLSAPTWSDPELKCFSAYQPRPVAPPYYDYEMYAETDEEPLGSECSDIEGGGASQMSGSLARVSGDEAVEGHVHDEGEVQQPQPPSTAVVETADGANAPPPPATTGTAPAVPASGGVSLPLDPTGQVDTLQRSTCPTDIAVSSDGAQQSAVPVLQDSGVAIAIAARQIESDAAPSTPKAAGASQNESVPPSTPPSRKSPEKGGHASILRQAMEAARNLNSPAKLMPAPVEGNRGQSSVIKAMTTPTPVKDVDGDIGMRQTTTATPGAAGCMNSVDDTTAFKARQDKRLVIPHKKQKTADTENHETGEDAALLPACVSKSGPHVGTAGTSQQTQHGLHEHIPAAVANLPSSAGHVTVPHSNLLAGALLHDQATKSQHHQAVTHGHAHTAGTSIPASVAGLFEGILPPRVVSGATAALVHQGSTGEVSDDCMGSGSDAGGVGGDGPAGVAAFSVEPATVTSI